ncbi:MAG: hypothetical protein ACU83V_05730 [Gammaproteobacteria bacterium]
MIKIAFSLFIAALTLFFTAEILSFLPVSAPEKVFYHLGALSLLASFLLWLITLLLLAGKQIVRGICGYFSGIERQQRRRRFMLGKIEQERRLFSLRTRQTRYFIDVKRKRLARADDRKHSRSLARAISRDLAMIKPRIPPERFKAWRLQNTQCRRQADIVGLIALQQTIIPHL